MRKPARIIRIEGATAYVPLTKGYEAVIDAADAWLVERWNWFALQASGKVYAGRGTAANGVKYTVLMHRHLLSAPPSYDVDHRDLDGLNCRRRNLRLCTPSQNLQNTPVSARNKLGIKGVFHNGSSFVATIQAGGVGRYLGSFNTAEEAKAAYDAAASATFGEFARVA